VSMGDREADSMSYSWPLAMIPTRPNSWCASARTGGWLILKQPPSFGKQF
jgi:hypothetical protein